MRWSLLDVTAKEGARRVALRHLDQAARAAARLRDLDDDEALHDLRVALRRLRSNLRAYQSLLSDDIGERHRRRVAKLASRTGPGREAEVQLAWIARIGDAHDEAHAPGLRWLAQRLERQRDEAYAHVREILAQRFERMHDKLRARLARYTRTLDAGEPVEEPCFADFTASVVTSELAELVGSLAAIESADDQEPIHRARLVGKRLRYSIEPLRGHVEGAREAVRTLKALQDLLGDLNDLHDLARLTGEAIDPAAAASLDAPGADERPGLLDLLSRVQTERARLFAQLEDEWRGGTLDELDRGVRAVAARLEARAPRAHDLEIERKYLLTALPPVCREHEAIELDQGYLPGERLIERIRRKRTSKGEVYVRTVKLGEGVVRIEVEEACSAEVFQTLWSLTEGRRVRKRRYPIAEGGLVWEIDEFLDRELWLAEVELPAADTEVIVPEWLAPYLEREVTSEPEYVNANLAR